jgi:phosphoribosylanthranilate isomerase
LNFYAPSPRSIALGRAQQIACAVAGRAQLVGVFVNMDVGEVLRIAREVPLDWVQLHGNETVAECEAIAAAFPVIRALKADAGFTAAHAAGYAFCRGLLLDTPCAGHGGSGEFFDWSAIPWQAVRAAAPGAMLFLAGGLDARNVGRAIATARPDAVDVASGVESEKGIKSVEKMREFIAAVQPQQAKHGLPPQRAAESEEP